MAAGLYKQVIASATTPCGAFCQYGAGLADYEIKEKGLVNRLVSTAFCATRFVGAAQNAIELFTGDWLPDKEDRISHQGASRENEVQN
jgi:hypothetical protein